MEESFYDKQVDKALMGLIKGTVVGGGKRLASDVSSTLKLLLACGTEPFFRCDMGERYLGKMVAAGWGLWLITTIATIFSGSSLRWILPARHKNPEEWCMIIGVVLSLAVFVIFSKFCSENMKRIAEFRAQRIPYHTKSRGRPRWSPFTDLQIRIGASAILLFFAPVTGIAFVVSMFVTANLAAEQQAAIQAAYLDALDAQIESQFMQEALLGKVPPEITYLYQPLSEKMNPELREDIAAAFVGKSVKMVAQAPKPKGAAKGPGSDGENSPNQPLFATNQASRPQPSASDASQRSDFYSSSRSAAGAGKESPTNNLWSKRVISLAVIVIVLAGCVALGIPLYRKIQSRQPAVALLSEQQVPKVNPDGPPPTVAKAQPPPVSSSATAAWDRAAAEQAASEAQQRQEAERAKQQAALEEQKRQEEAKKKAALEFAKRQEREKLIEQINSTVSSQAARLSEFKTECQTRLDNNTNKLDKVSFSARKNLKKTNDEFRDHIANNIQIQEASLENVKKDMQAVASNPQLDPQKISDELTSFIATTESDHKNITDLLNTLDIAISNAPRKWALFNIQIK